MKNTIEMISDTEFALTSRGNRFTLKYCVDDGDCDYLPWTMECVNASTKAWRGAMPSMRHFESLRDVEGHYKSWIGITDLVLILDTNIH